MKKTFCFIALMAICWLAQGQKLDTTTLIINARTSLGIRIGFTQSQLRGDNIDSLSVNGKTTSLQGFHVGLSANSGIGKYLWFKHELLLTQKGANVTLNDKVNGNYNTTLRTWSLDLFPVSPTFRYKGFQVYAGPYVSVLLDANLRKKNSAGEIVDDHSIFGSANSNQSRSKYLQKFDYGFNVGMEYEFPFGITLGAKYTKGFSELLDDANATTVGKNTDPTRIKIYSDFVNVSVGYNFIRGNKSR